MFVCQMCSFEIYNVKYMLISAGKVMKQISTMSSFYVVSSATKHILPSVNFNVQRSLLEDLQSGWKCFKNTETKGKQKWAI